jgi:hypothetical protein
MDAADMQHHERLLKSMLSTLRDRARPVGARFDHGERRYPLGVAVSRRQTRINQKAMAVHIKPDACLDHGSRCTALPLLAMEVGFGIAAAKLASPLILTALDVMLAPK